MKLKLMHYFFLAALVTLVGCDWESYNEEDSWVDEGYSWVNLTGSYRAKTAKDIMVVDPAFGTGSGGGTSTITTNTKTELSDDIIVSDGALTVLAGQCAYYPLVPGTLRVVGSGYTFLDSAGTSNLVGTAGAVGSVEYETGKVTLDFGGVAPEPNQHFIASYVWIEGINESGVFTNATGTPQGNSGSPIYMMLVSQQGNKITVSDSNGDQYEGMLISVESTAGTGSVGADGMIIAQYQLQGLGKKSNVTIEGVFMGEYVRQKEMSVQEQLIRQSMGQTINPGSVGSTAMFINRTMTGTWLEHDQAGTVVKAGDVFGVSDVQTGSQTVPVENTDSMPDVVINV
ncbi:MAG: hypothetical protein WCL44_07385 [bacterium]